MSTIQQDDKHYAVRKTVALLLEGIALFLALAVPYLLVEIEPARAASRLVAVVYVLGSFAASMRDIPRIWRSWLSAFVTTFLIGFAGAFLAGTIWGLLAVGTTYWANGPLFAAPIGALWPDRATPFVISVVPAGILVAGLALAWIRRRDGSGDLLRWRLPGASSGTLFVLAAIAALSVGLAAIWFPGIGLDAFAGLVDMLTRHRTTPLVWEIVVAYPTMPISLLAGAMMLAVHRRTLPAIIALVDSRPEDHVRLRGGVLILCLVSLGAGAGALGAVSRAQTALLATAFDLRENLEPALSTAATLHGWVLEQQTAGRPAAEVADHLNANGHWSPQAPEAGLAAFLPEDAELTGLPMQVEPLLAGRPLWQGRCRVSATADVADGAELSAITWLTPEFREQAVRFCVAVSCPATSGPNPAPWLFLYSSHPSRNAYWAENLFVDVLGKGVVEQGGYCTVSGLLSDGFQG